MNETDVREALVRPLLTQLGYEHGTEADIRTEVTLSYSQTFLGRKNPKKDPPLLGRADYVCEVVATGKWVVEVKAPSEPLDIAVVQQAHTYAAHPEIAAFYFLITNGRTYKLFETGRLEAPLIAWNYEQQSDIYLRLFNVLSPDAIKRRANRSLVDPETPLAKGLASELRIIGGKISYDKQIGTHPLLSGMSVEGLELPVTGGYVKRERDKRILAQVSIAKVAPLMRTFGAAGLEDEYAFHSSSDYLSQDAEHPSIFQNFQMQHIQQGAKSTFGGLPFAMPFDLSFSAITEAVGWIEADTFKGTMRISSQVLVRQEGRTMLTSKEERTGITQLGRFEIILLSRL